MTISLEQFVHDVVQSGLIPQGELADYQSTIPAEKRPADAKSLALELVRDRMLTKYQAGKVLEGNANELVLGEYVLLQKIGEGGMGQVFKAIHRPSQRHFAVKILQPDLLDSPEVVKRFRREGGTATRLNHPNIIASYDAGEQDGVYYLVMEYVKGRTLSSLLRKGGPMSVAQALDYVIQAGRGLEYAHGQGIVHRDVKPSNLLLDEDDTVKVLDMGLARIVEADDVPDDATLIERLTKTCQTLGTVDYMSPEQALDTRTADHRSDVYSLGCTLYRLLTGHPVYVGESAVTRLVAHCEEEIPALRDSLNQVPSELNRVFSKMVAKKPEDRYQSMTEVIADLQACRNPGKLTLGPVFAASSATPGSSAPPLRDESTVTWQDESPLATREAEPVEQPSSETTVRFTTTKTSFTEEEPDSPTGRGRMRWLLAGIGIAAVLVVLLVLYLRSG